jgi:2-dehydropantoate 2-reductase
MTHTPPHVLVLGANAFAIDLGRALELVGAKVRFMMNLADASECDRDHTDSATVSTAPIDLVLFGVAPDDATHAAVMLGRLVRPGTLVIALLPGIRRLTWIAHAARSLHWIRCVVLPSASGKQRGKRGEEFRHKLYLSAHPRLRQWHACFEQAGFELNLREDMQPVQWGFLLLQLESLFKLASGLSRFQMLKTRTWRIRYAQLLKEALGLLKSTGIEPRPMHGIPWRSVPILLCQKEPLFSWMALRHLLAVDIAPSTLNTADEVDLEVLTDSTCGEIMRLAVGLGADAPRTVNLAEHLTYLNRHGANYAHEAAS